MKCSVGSPDGPHEWLEHADSAQLADTTITNFDTIAYSSDRVG
jgi:hypothetical protein